MALFGIVWPIGNMLFLRAASMSRRLTIKIPKDYKTKFERKNREYDLGYSSFPEFIKDCMRRRFEEVDEAHGKKA